MPAREGREFMQAHIRSIGSWPTIKPFLLSTVELLKSQGIQSIGIYGFCFGGTKITELMLHPDTKPFFKAAALIHPARLEAGDGELFDIPVALIPSGGEDGEVMDSIWTSLQRKNFAEKCVRKNFLNATHGFVSVREEWDDLEKAGRVQDVYEILGAFSTATCEGQMF